MTITLERKAALMQEYRRSDADTGSPEVQVAMLSERIEGLTGHLKSHRKDHAARRGLLMLVSRRRGLLDYLKRHSADSYRDMISRLNLRK